MMSETTAVRHRRIQSPATTDGEDGRTSWLLCRAASRLYAIPLEHVIESMRALPIEAISGAPRYVRGLSIIRGSPVPVVDPGLLLCDQPTQAQRLVTIRSGRRTIALAAEAVLGIRSIAAETFSQLSPLLRDAAAETIAAIGTLDAELLFLLRATRIVPDDLLDRLGADGGSA
jgi:purine-binding chemotaxis protein CheW